MNIRKFSFVQVLHGQSVTRPVAVLLLLLAATLALWLGIRAHGRADELEDISKSLAAINAHKTEQINSWIAHHEREALRFTRHPFLADIVSEELALPGSRSAQLKAWLTDHAKQKRYQGMALLSPKGNPIVATSGYIEETKPPFKAAFSLAAQKRVPQLTDLYLDRKDTPAMALLSPISPGGRGGRPVCVLVAKIDPKEELYPLVKAAPLLFSQAETLLTRREGDQALFLNYLDYESTRALKFRKPLSDKTLPAAAALQGKSGFFKGEDYRGEPVYSSIGRIKRKDWAVVTKVDQASVLGPIKVRESLILALMLGIALLLFITFHTVLLNRERAAQARVIKAEKALDISEQIFSEFMEHSPIYVFFKDENIRSLRLSRNFEKMIGRPFGELLGKNMNELFPSDFAQKMVADDLKILREGKEITIEEELNGRHYITTKFPINLEGKPPYLAGFTIDVTERKRSEDERLAHIRFLEDMDQVNRSIQNATDIEKMMGSILNTVLKIFDCDRAWLFYPCDPDAPFFRVPMEVSKPEYPGAKVLNTDLPMPPEMAENLREALRSSGPVIYTLGTERAVNKVTAEQFGVKSQIFTALYPKIGKPWVFGIHQCSHPRIWTQEEARLLQEIGRRLTDSLTSLLSIRDLRKSEQRLKEAQRLARIGNWTLDLVSGELSWSDEIYRIFEMDPQKFGASYEAFLETIHPDDREMVNKAYTDSVTNKSPYNITHRLLMKDGSVKYVNECCETLYDDSDRPVKSTGTVQDITERTISEQEKARLLERLNLAKTAAKLGVWDWDIPENILAWDDQMYELYGIRKADFTGVFEAWRAALHPEDRPAMEEVTRRALAGEIPYDTEFRVVLPGGTVRHIKANADIFRGQDGKPRRMVGINFDITERKLTEQKLRESEERLRVTLEETQIGTWDWDVAADVWQASPTYFTMLGYKAEPGPADRKVWLTRVHPEDRDHVASKISSVLAGTEVKYQYEARMLHADGTYRWHLVLGTTVKKGADGKTSRMMGVRIDITQRKVAEESLRKKEQAMNEAQRLAKIGNWEWDALSDTITWSEEYYRIYGLDPSQKPPGYLEHLKAYTPESAARLDAAVKRHMANGEPYQLDLELASKNAPSRWITARSESICGPDGKIVGLRGTAQDITSRKLAELEIEKLNRGLADKNQEMENFLYITTHDLRSPLVNIQGFSQNLQRYQAELRRIVDKITGVPPEDAAKLRELTAVRVPEALDFVLGSSGKMDALITALLKVSRIGRVEMKPERVKMQETLKKVLDAMRFQLEKSGARVKTGSLPPCTADPGAISQIFTNLLDNAVKYHNKARAPEIEVSGEVKGGMVLYKVADNGPGIPGKDLSRVWNVFYSHERSTERGEGIGLPMVRRMVERNGGNIKVESKEGAGTVFYIELPAAGGAQ